MNTLVLCITGLIAFPFFFPKKFITLAHKARTWLDERRQKRAREENESTQLMMAYQAWEEQIKQLYVHLSDRHHQPDLFSQFIQVRATGEQFLAQTNRHTFPALYQKTELVYHHLKQVEEHIRSISQ